MELRHIAFDNLSISPLNMRFGTAPDVSDILPTIRNLLLAKDLMDRYRLPRPQVPFQFISAINRLPADATQHLLRKKDGGISGYALGIAAQNAHRFERARLIEGMDACLDANLRIVTSQLDHELILTEIVIRVIGESR